MKWLGLRECSYACVGRVKCLKSPFRSKWALLPKMLPLSIDVHWHITQNVSKCIRALSMKQCRANRGTASFLGWAPSAMPGEESKPQGGRTLMIPEVYSRVIVTNVTAPNDLGSMLCTSIFTIQCVSVRSSYFHWLSCLLRKGSKFKRQSSSCPNSLPKRQTDSLTH